MEVRRDTNVPDDIEFLGRFLSPHTKASLMEGHRRLDPPIIVFMGIPNLFDQAFVQVRIVHPKVTNLVDVPTTDLEGD
jgi:hypothetical protein